LLAEIQRHVRHNFIVSVLDGAFFGFALGLASSVTVLPLFVSTLTDSTVLIGLIASIQAIGWQLPQLLTAVRVARLKRYKPMVVLVSFHERWPFFGLALVAWLLPTLGAQITLILTYLLLIWQAFGGGFTATAWQSMTGKIMPPNLRGTFWGTQAAGVNLMSSIGAVLAGALLLSLPSPMDFTVCFLIAGSAMMVSWGFLALTREPGSPASVSADTTTISWSSMISILRRDTGFRRFLGARILGQLAWTAISFYTIYAVRTYDLDEQTAGLFAGLMAFVHMAASPLLGWIGDRWGHRAVFMTSGLAIAGSALVAVTAASIGWFFLVFGLAGFFNAVLWTTTMAMTAEFGSEQETPLYFGLSNTVVGPVTLLAPLLGGWLADTEGLGFHATFLLSAISGLLMMLVLYRIPSPKNVQPVDGAPAPLSMPAEQ
jgi:MFS family permease